LDVQLNFINQSNDTNNSDVVIFQKNVATDFDDIAVAWEVIQNCGEGDNHPFEFPMGTTVAAGDSWGNYTPQLTAKDGQMFAMKATSSGDTLAYIGPASEPAEIQMRNEMTQGAMSACVYRGGKLLALKTSMAPQQQTAFAFKPTIWIGAVSQVVQGQVMNSAILSSINTELSLLGISSADIIMTGGGPGPASTPFQFNLANIVEA